MAKPRTFKIADLFCGAGGTTTGAVEALRALKYDVHVTAVNHWDIAVATHSANHPDARHLCASLDSTNPRDLFKEGELDVLLASPECMGHSNALGGRPINDQSRATAWCVLRWADALLPPAILIENVPEFLNWAPLGSNGRPLRSKKGDVFASWTDAFRALGYKVDYRIFCAADYGDPTTRRRLFIQAVRGRRKIVWPHATHAPAGSPSLFSGRQWTPARAIIDSTHKGTSIFDRQRPLSANTLDRIREGAEKYWPEPFVVALRGTSNAQIRQCCSSIDVPLPTVAAGGNHLYVAEPIIVGMEHGGSVQTASKPLRTITTAKGGAMALAEPFLVQVAHGNGNDKNGNARRAKSIDNPLPTVCGKRGDFAVVEPLILPQMSGGAVRPVSSPLPTVTTTSRGIGLLEPFLVKYYATGGACSLNEPLDTVTTKHRFGIVLPSVEVNGETYYLDILFRMLQPAELAGAQGFPKNYKFTGTKTQVVKQIGNAVPRRLARALVAAVVSQNPDVSWLVDEEDAAESAKGAA